MPLKFQLGIHCGPGVFTLDDILFKNMPHSPIFLTATGKQRCCLLNIMVHSGQISPDKILQADDLTEFCIGSNG